MSWAGITRDELVPIPADNSPLVTPLPAGSAWTIPLPAACAAFVRLISREERGSLRRLDIIEGLSSVIGESLFDMSYEGDYMEFLPNDQPLSDEEMVEIDNAVAEMNRWPFRKEEEWIREILIQVVRGEKIYNDIPYRGE